MVAFTLRAGLQFWHRRGRKTSTSPCLICTHLAGWRFLSRSIKEMEARDDGRLFGPLMSTYEIFHYRWVIGLQDPLKSYGLEGLFRFFQIGTLGMFRNKPGQNPFVVFCNCDIQ
jgi:hypothetical protein